MNILPAPTFQDPLAPGAWSGSSPLAPPDVDFSANALVQAAARFRERVHVLRDGSTGGVGVSFGEDPSPLAAKQCRLSRRCLPFIPSGSGQHAFCDIHRVRFPYVAGAMAHGIASRPLVIAMARAELLAFFGSAGVSPSDVEASVVAIDGDLARERRLGGGLNPLAA